MTKEFNNIVESLESFNNEKFPNCIFYKKNDNTLFVADYKNNYLWVNYELIWSVFEQKYKLSYNDVENKIKLIINNIEHWNKLLPNGRMKKH